MAKSKQTETSEQPVSSEKHSTVAHVHDRHGRVARSFSREVHGEDFVKLAHEFAKTQGHPAVVEE